MNRQKAKLIGSAIMGAIMVLDYGLTPSIAAEPSYSVLPAQVSVIKGIVRSDTAVRFEDADSIYVGHYKHRPKKAQPTYTEKELELLACTIYCEAASDSISDETRRMVGEVVLNRVADPRYPDTIEAVLTQRSQYGRFHWTGVVWPSRAAKEKEAVERAYDCARQVFTEPRLLPEDVVYQAEFSQGTECVVHAPGFYFCR